MKQEAEKSGGDWSVGRYHVFIGFSTGHFGTDPVHGIAMRRLAFSVINNSLAVGDRVTPIAWEMETWDVGPTVTLTDDPATRAQFVDRVPYAPRTGSHGGHDIERILYETLTKEVKPDEAGSSIVLLLTNSNASQGPTGERADLFGANNPKLIQALREGKYRVPPIRKEFRLFAGSQPVTVSVIGLFPQKLTPLSGAPTGPRYPTFARDTWQPPTDRPAEGEALPNPGAVAKHAAAPEQAPARSGMPWWVWPLLALLMIAGAVGFLIFRRAGTSPAPQAAAPKPKPAVPRGNPIPGSLTIQIGATEQVLQPLTTASRWTLQRDDEGAVTLVDSSPAEPTPEAAPKPGTPLAQLSFDEKRNLLVTADSGAQFTELKGSDPSALDSRNLTISPGKTALCRIIPVGSTTKTRFEVSYSTIAKGNRV